jgi:hypothetical protein
MKFKRRGVSGIASWRDQRKHMTETIRLFAGRHGLVVLSLALAAGALALSWNWLAAAGVMPLVLALAPCAAMCALGLCMNKMGKSSSSTEQGTVAGKDSCCRAPTNSKTASLSKHGDRSSVS